MRLELGLDIVTIPGISADVSLHSDRSRRRWIRPLVTLASGFPQRLQFTVNQEFQNCMSSRIRNCRLCLHRSIQGPQGNP